MKQNDVQIGMTARVKIGQRLAEVKVLREIDLGGWKNRRRFECRTVDTGRLIKATAAAPRGAACPEDGRGGRRPCRRRGDRARAGRRPGSLGRLPGRSLLTAPGTAPSPAGGVGPAAGSVPTPDRRNPE
jgi:hypothetical protein